MKTPSFFYALAASLVLTLSAGAFNHSPSIAYAQDNGGQTETGFERARTLYCTNGTGSGTYGYRMSGSIVGVGPFLVNGLFFAKSDGTSTARVILTINGRSMPTTGVNGTLTTKDDCTGTGTFFIPELGQQITYAFILTDSGNQIEILNTNPGIVLHGVGRRIAREGRSAHCTNGMIHGNYGYRLEGSLPGVPSLAALGLIRHATDENHKGVISGFDAISFNGQQIPRRDDKGTFTVNNDCTGTGRYADNLGNTVDFVFTVVNGGREIYLQGASSTGDNVTGVARRLK